QVRRIALVADDADGTVHPDQTKYTKNRQHGSDTVLGVMCLPHDHLEHGYGTAEQERGENEIEPGPVPTPYARSHRQEGDHQNGRRHKKDAGGGFNQALAAHSISRSSLAFEKNFTSQSESRQDLLFLPRP